MLNLNKCKYTVVVVKSLTSMDMNGVPGNVQEYL